MARNDRHYIPSKMECVLPITIGLSHGGKIIEAKSPPGVADQFRRDLGFDSDLQLFALCVVLQARQLEDGADGRIVANLLNKPSPATKLDEFARLIRHVASRLVWILSARLER